MTTSEALDLIRAEAEKARVASGTATPHKKAEAKRLQRNWQACLEVATEIYHADAPDSLERIMAIKLTVRLLRA